MNWFALPDQLTGFSWPGRCWGSSVRFWSLPGSPLALATTACGFMPSAGTLTQLAAVATLAGAIENTAFQSCPR